MSGNVYSLSLVVVVLMDKETLSSVPAKLPTLEYLVCFCSGRLGSTAGEPLAVLRLGLRALVIEHSAL